MTSAAQIRRSHKNILFFHLTEERDIARAVAGRPQSLEKLKLKYASLKRKAANS